MKQQQAFTGNKKMLKGGLHSHTTRSDGGTTPEETIRYYYQNGFDFLALTDHRVYNFENFAPDLSITIIPGMEFDNPFQPGKGFRTYHTLCFGPAKEDGNGFEQDQHFDPGTAETQEEYQVYMDNIHAKNNVTILAHPEWSSTPPRYFQDLKGNFAMEIWNTGCAYGHNSDKNAAYWDDILGQGILMYGVATDDGHGMGAHCKGWVMVKAENNINDILRALQAGEFYSSCGPEIYNFYVEGDMAVVECSPVNKICFQSDKHPTVSIGGDGMTRYEFDMKKYGRGGYDYIRVTLIDKDGNYAWTNPIFLN